MVLQVPNIILLKIILCSLYFLPYYSIFILDILCMRPEDCNVLRVWNKFYKKLDSPIFYLLFIYGLFYDFSISWNIQRQMIERVVNNKYERSQMEAIAAWLFLLSWHLLAWGGLENSQNTSVTTVEFWTSYLPNTIQSLTAWAPARPHPCFQCTLKATYEFWTGISITIY
jgi:hypothetical protein